MMCCACSPAPFLVVGVRDPQQDGLNKDQKPLELSGLSLDREHERGQQPDAPKVTSHGVVTFDITDKFVTAAKGSFSPGRCGLILMPSDPSKSLFILTPPSSKAW